jgi:hypothetical protein
VTKVKSVKKSTILFPFGVCANMYIQSVPELAYIPLTANGNIYSEMDSARKNV